jgi:hypothetical protein
MKLKFGGSSNAGSPAPADDGSAKAGSGSARSPMPNFLTQGWRRQASTETPSANDLRSRMQSALPESGKQSSKASPADVQTGRSAAQAGAQSVQLDPARYAAPPKDDGSLAFADARSQHRQKMEGIGAELFSAAQGEKAAKGIDVDTTRRQPVSSDPVVRMAVAEGLGRQGQAMFAIAQGEKAARGIDVDTTRRQPVSSDPVVRMAVAEGLGRQGQTMFAIAQDEKAAKGIDVDTTRHSVKPTGGAALTSAKLLAAEGKMALGNAQGERAAKGVNVDATPAQAKPALQSKAEAALPSPDRSGAAGMALPTSVAPHGKATPAA